MLVRTPEIFYKDGLWPVEYEPKSKVINKSERLKALVEVLSSISEFDYYVLKKNIKNVQWYVPEKERMGEVFPIWYGKKSILYLSPYLEIFNDQTLEFVAHELAHVYLGHFYNYDKKKKVFFGPPHEMTEKQVAFQLKKWGFSKKKKSKIILRLNLTNKKPQSPLPEVALGLIEETQTVFI
ncbi:hypothetical protein MYX76_03345 [Desulfobacterota bacterium AH_259_B03_O07]|nr:hypothetical protein [Desulfobacterota bacterium AH_259_B03_O07]